MDLVLRISRMHSIWLDTQINSPIYLAPVVEPRSSEQPLGTSLGFDYRGATVVTPPTANITKDATFLDFYGNPALCLGPPPPPPAPPCPLQVCTSNGVPSFSGTPPSKAWHSSITELNTAKFFQVRVTFVSNTETGLTPTLSALGFAFRSP